MHRAQWFKCDGPVCGGQRLHEVVTTEHPDGRVTREIACTACAERKPFGVYCPGCGGCKFRHVYTRHKPNGVTARRRSCVHCNRAVTTRERLDAAPA